MLYIVSIFLVMMLLLFLWTIEAFRLISWRWFFTCLGYGCICGFVILSFADYCKTEGVMQSDGSLFLHLLVAEVIKMSLLLYMIHTRQVVFLFEAFLYGLIVGTGFSVIDNFMVFGNLQPLDVNSHTVCVLFCTILHWGLTAVSGMLMLVVYKRVGRMNFVMLLSMIPAALVYLQYLHYTLSALAEIVLVLSIECGAFFSLVICYRRMMEDWLKSSNENCEELVSSLLENALPNTRAGRYLAMIKERISPEDYFDLVVYLQLYWDYVTNPSCRRQKIDELNQIQSHSSVLGALLIEPVVLQLNFCRHRVAV